jgi:hypothetical protein
VLLPKYSVEPFEIGVKVHEVFLAVLLKIDLIDGAGLRNEDLDVHLVEST